MIVKQNLWGNSREEQRKEDAKRRNTLSFITRDGGIKPVIALASAALSEVLEILSQRCKEK